MHHVVLERWSRGSSFLHRRDARIKTLAALTLLLLLAFTRHAVVELAAIVIPLLLAAAWLAGIPPAALLFRAAFVLPFSATFALVSWLAGDPGRAVSLVLKSYASAFVVLLLAATTPVPHLLRGFQSLGIPVFFLTVTQLLYRYLFVLGEEAQHMRVAASSRGAAGPGSLRFRAAAGALAVLFARAHERAGRIHRAMLARGFDGRYRLLSLGHAGWADLALLLATVAAAALLYIRLEAA